MEIVLHQPEIPSNTGNIGRTCVATGSGLHIIEPTGFILNDKYLRRAGMEAHQCYTDVHYGLHDFIMFGKESAGIPEDILVENEDHCIRIPMGPDIRSLNLANSVAIVLYEALRQQGFHGLEEYGNLHHLKWKEKDS